MQKIKRGGLKSLVINISITIFVVILMFLLLDIFVRIMFPQYKQVHVYDDNFIHRLIPNSEKIEVMSEVDGGERIVIEINDLGFRNTVFSKNKTKQRIMVYGDSFIEGEFSQIDDTFSKKLEQKLNDKSGEDVEVINAGVMAYGPDQISLRIKDEIKDYDPDLIILSLFVGNDYGDNIRDKIYRIEGNEIVKNDYHISFYLRMRRKLATLFPSTAAYFHAFNQIKRGITNSQEIPEKYIESYVNRNQDDCREYLILEDNKINNVFGDRGDYDIVVDPENSCSLYKIKLMEKIIEEIKKTTLENDVELLVLIIPGRLVVDDHLFKKMIAREYPNFNRSLLTDITSELVEKQNINFINLYPYFLEKNINSSFYFIGDGHWNKEGQDFASQIVAENILQKEGNYEK